VVATLVLAVLPANPLQHSMGAGKVLRVGAVREGRNAEEGWGVRGWSETLGEYLNRTLRKSLDPPVGVELAYYAYDDLIEEVSASIILLEHISHLTERQSMQIPASHPPVAPLLHGSCSASLPCRLLSSLRADCGAPSRSSRGLSVGGHVCAESKFVAPPQHCYSPTHPKNTHDIWRRGKG
jgi:hypothetical protein